MEKIPGPALCGFADYFDDTVLGAKPHGKPHGTPAPKNVKLKPYPKAKQSSIVATHAKVLKNARKILAKAHGAVKGAARKVLAKPAPVRPAAVAQRRVAPASRFGSVPTAASRFGAGVVVRGDEYVVIGASVVPPKNQPKVRAAQAKLLAAKTKVGKARAVAAAATKKAHVTLTALAKQVKKHEAVARKLSKGGKMVGPPAGHRVHGYIGDDAAGLWPGDQGYDATTENGADGPRGSNPWDAGMEDLGSADTSIDPTTGEALSPQLDLETLVTITPAGSVPMDQVFLTPPGDAIKYDESKGRPDGCLLSQGLATRKTDVWIQADAPGTIDGTAHFGYVWKTYPQKRGIDGIYYGEDLGKEGWNHVHGRKWYGNNFSTNNVPPEEAYTSAATPVDPARYDGDGVHMQGFGPTATGPAQQTYGPLVGNPTTGNPFNGARVAADGTVFWIASEAPDWLTLPLKTAAAMTKAAAEKAAKDAAAAAAAAIAKAAADAAAALAAQQAQNALDEAAAASKGRQDTSRAQADADTADAQMAQADAQYATSDAAQAQADAQYAAQQQQQDMAERQWQFQQMQQQAQMEQQQYQQEQQYQQQQAQQPQPQYQDQQPRGGGSFDTEDVADAGDGGGSDAGDDFNDFGPESQADEEAANIEADADVLGQVLGQPTIAGDDAVIGGDGEQIGLDQWGNLTE